MSSKIQSAMIALAALTGFCASASAEIFHVLPNDGADLEAKVAAARPTDTVLVPPGYYSIQSSLFLAGRLIGSQQWESFDEAGCPATVETGTETVIESPPFDRVLYFIDDGASASNLTINGSVDISADAELSDLVINGNQFNAINLSLFLSGSDMSVRLRRNRVTNAGDDFESAEIGVDFFPFALSNAKLTVHSSRSHYFGMGNEAFRIIAGTSFGFGSANTDNDVSVNSRHDCFSGNGGVAYGVAAFDLSFATEPPIGNELNLSFVGTTTKDNNAYGYSNFAALFADLFGGSDNKLRALVRNHGDYSELPPELFILTPNIFGGSDNSVEVIGNPKALQKTSDVLPYINLNDFLGNGPPTP